MLHHTWVWFCLVALRAATAVDYTTYPEVVRFQEYVQINTTSGADMQPAVTFWKKLAAAQNVAITELELVTGCPVLILKWPGSDSTLHSIMLNSHMDVVPANVADGWTYPPFDATISSDGVMWGRGTQDMKSISLQHYEALSLLAASEDTLLRDVYMTLMPDEEVGGTCGMVPFLASDEFAAMNVIVAFDEGGPLPRAYIPMLYHDKAIFQIQVDCYGTAGHGSTMPAINSTAVGQCRNVINSLLAFREEQYKISSVASFTDASGYTSVNLDIVQAGTATNVIPNHMRLIFDIRLAFSVDVEAFETQLAEWIAAAGSNVTLTYLLKNSQTPGTIINSTNPFYVAINEVATELNLTVVPFIAPGSTDSRYVRGSKIPAFGFSPLPNTQTLVHAVNERLSLETFLNGIPIYKKVIKSVANLSKATVGTDPSAFVSWS